MKDNRINRWVALLLAGFLLSLALTGTPAQAISSPPIIALYYTWYDKGSWSYDAMTDLPVPIYSSSDGETMQRHVQQAHDVGIDVLMCIWHGPEEPVQDGRCRRLEKAVRESGYDMQVAFLLDLSDQSPDTMRTREGLTDALDKLKSDLIGKDSYLKMNGKPAVFWKNPNYFGSVEDWRRFRNQVDLDRQQTWIITTDIPNFEDDIFSYLDVFDAVFPYDVSQTTTPGEALALYASRLNSYNTAHKTQKPFIATVMPGYDDTRINANGHRRDRAGGAYYRSSWAAATQYRPSAVFLSSFNGFFEGSYIETSELYGYDYLNLTRDLIASFRAAVPATRSGSSQGRVLYYAQTGHFLRGAFLSYWERNGGLSKFGYPITEEYVRDSDQKVVQFFERARFELRVVNNQAAVDLGLLGSEYADLMDYTDDPAFQAVAAFASTGAHRYFPETGHSVQGGFKLYWEQNGGLGFFGYPISEEFTEAFPDGSKLLVQYFERARLERHDNGTVSMGLLGTTIAPCHQLNPRDQNSPPDGPLAEGENNPCVEVDKYQGTPYNTETRDAIPGITEGPAARGRVYPTVSQPGQVLGFEGWEFQPNETLTLWLNKPDGSVRGISYQAVANESGYVLIGFQTERTDPEGQWSLVARGNISDRVVVAPFELRW